MLPKARPFNWYKTRECHPPSIWCAQRPKSAVSASRSHGTREDALKEAEQRDSRSSTGEKENYARD